MRWDNFRRSTNIEQGQSGGDAGLGGGGFRVGRGHLGIGAVVAILLASWGLGIDPTVLLQALSNGEVPGQSSTGNPDTQDSTQTTTGSSQNPDQPFVAAVLGETEDRWAEILKERGVTYEPPKLVIFRA